MTNFTNLLAGGGGLDELNKHLTTNSYVGGFLPSQEDDAAATLVHNGVCAATYPHVARWLRHVMSFSEFTKAKWAGAGEVKLDHIVDEVQPEPEVQLDHIVDEVQPEPEVKLDHIVDEVQPEPEVQLDHTVDEVQPEPEVKLDHIVNVVVPPEVTPQGNPEYISFDDDKILGQQFPSLSSIEYVTGADVQRPVEGQNFLIILWAQYHKPGFPTLSLYSDLKCKFGSNLPFMALSLDPEIVSPQKYMADPAKKYSSVFPITYAVAHDAGNKIKSAIVCLLDGPVSIPHMFLVNDKGTIVWHQDHSQIGSTAASHMDLVESQAARLVTGVPLQSTGNRPVEEEEEEEDDDTPDAQAGAIDASFVTADSDDEGASNY